jgi:serine/alanine adding enzyme
VIDTAIPIVVSTETTPTAWDEYVEAHPAATGDHLWRWREVFSGVFGHECRYLVARRDRAVVGLLPMVLFNSRLFGRAVVSVPFLNYGGVLASDAEATAALVEEAGAVARAFRASHVELRHRDRQCPDLPFRQHKLGFLRALPSTRDALWQATDRKVRNQVRKAQKEGLVCVHGGVELVDEFYRVFAENMRDLGTPVYTKRLFSSTLTIFAERARVFVVRRGDQPMAVGITFGFRDTTIVPWASSLRAYRQLCPNMLLYWTMLEHAVSSGVSTFDFGRSSPGSGPHQFKLQWGAAEVPLHWEYVLLSAARAPEHGAASPRFSLAVELWKRLPLALANRLGPHIVRHIP